MNNASVKSSSLPGLGETSIQHYLVVLLHRKWLILIIFLLVTAATLVVSSRLPNVYTSETLVLVDPQQVPSDYVRSTVSGDVRDRLSTLSQQILSAIRLQRVIDQFNLYPKERKEMHSEDVIGLMRNNISVNLVGGSGAPLQAFKIAYSNNDPKLAALVTKELADSFIEENLNVREELSTGTTDFLDQQLQGTRKNLEALESKIGDFKIKHLGEMPEQQQMDMQILSQLQVRLQELSDSLYRAQQQKNTLQVLIIANNPTPPPVTKNGSPPEEAATPTERELQAMLHRYGENYPDVKRLKTEVQEEQKEREQAQRKALAEAKLAEAHAEPSDTAQANPADGKATAGTSDAKSGPSLAGMHVSPEIQAQLASLDSDIARNKEDQQGILKEIARFQSRLENEPVLEQQVIGLVRDYAVSKDEYSQLLEKKLSAQMATQLEIRRKAEKFTILDPARVPQRPTRPNRLAIDFAGALAGLGLGVALALFSELLGPTLIFPAEVGLGLPVLGVIPTISTQYDRQIRKRWATAGIVAGVAMIVAACVFLYLRYGARFL
jgi:polysaccharide chain length determinant protein (PEP-CTERM system associated)